MGKSFLDLSKFALTEADRECLAREERLRQEARERAKDIRIGPGVVLVRARDGRLVAKVSRYSKEG